jgi:quinoprotein glucose dehydrogenase
MLATLTVFLMATPAAVCAEDWPTWGGPPGGSKYSPLTQINRDNVTDLEVAWTYRTGDFEGRMAPFGNSFGLQAVPILLPEEAGGHLVLCNPFWSVIALDPVTGEVRWQWDPEPAVQKGIRDLQYKCRGVSQWEDTQAAAGAFCKYRIFQVTGERRMFAIDAPTGKLCPDFGKGGTVVMDEAIGSIPHAHDVNAIRTYFPPAIVSDTVISGSVVGTKFQDAHAPSGAVYAFDARTGGLKWAWDPIPRNPGDPEAANWEPESLATTGGGNVWTYMTTDPERDLVFLPTSSASPNYYGINRPGDNRYANSTVALKGSTGELVWHFQAVHHDVWDWDVSPEPLAIDLTWEGKKRPAIAQLTKQGVIFVFDRDTGEPLWPITEVPVDTNGLPGEQLSPTQPFPEKPLPLAKFITTEDDAWGFTFFDRMACKEVFRKYRHGTMFTPPSLEGTIIQPGMVNNWGGGAFDPESNLLVTNVRRFSLFIGLPRTETLDPEASKNPNAGLPGGPPIPIKNTEYGMERGPEKVFSPMFAPCTAPPWYVLTAVNLSTGDVEWEVPLGVLDKQMRMPLPLKFGAVGIGGPMITAGGLVFIGATADERFRAFDSATGDELWVQNLPTSSMTVPMTYERDGRQFIVIAAGGHHIFYPQKVSDYLMAFALPEK